MSGSTMSDDGRPQILVDQDFRVDTLDKAVAVMRKYRSIAQAIARNHEIADSEHQRIDSWLERTNAPLAGRLEFYEAHLSAFAMKARSEGQKSVSLPDGEIKTRTVSPGFEVDRAVFLEWARENKRDDVMRVTYSPDMAGIKSAFLADSGTAIDPASGEVIPGLVPIPERVTVSVNPDLTAVDLDEEEDDGI